MWFKHCFGGRQLVDSVQHAPVVSRQNIEELTPAELEVFVQSSVTPCSAAGVRRTQTAKKY